MDKHTYVFVASVDTEETGFRWLELFNEEWTMTSDLCQATTCPIVSDLRRDLEKDEITDYTIHPVKLSVME